MLEVVGSSCQGEKWRATGAAPEAADAPGKALEEKEAGWHSQGPAVAPPGKLDPEAAKPAGGHGVLSTEAAQERLEHKYAAGKRTWFFWMVIALAANGGLLLGYDNGVAGGVISMCAFKRKFFPEIAAATCPKPASNTSDPWCTYDNHLLTLVISSLYLSAFFACFVAADLARRFGRRCVLILSGVTFVVGAALSAGAEHISMVVLGRLVLGLGVGGGTTVAPLYLAEMAPAQSRGTMNVLFQLMITIGILVASLINYGVSEFEWGWRVSWACAAVPGIVILLAGLLLPDSPASYAERGMLDKAKAVLMRVRGITDPAQIKPEFDDIVEAANISRAQHRPIVTFMMAKQYRPQFLISSIFMLYQQFDGINAVIFFAPILFSSLGGGNAALLNTVIVNLVNVCATFLVIYAVDRWGRRIVLIGGATHMFITQVVIAGLLGRFYSNAMPTDVSIVVVVFVCLFVSGHAWSWGPVGWLYPVEIQPLETRAAGAALNTGVNMLFTFIIGQCFVSMLCAMHYGVFLFFAGWLIIMALTVYFFFPETNGIPLEEVHYAFNTHWLWRRVLA